MMKALTLTQPWATLVAIGAKRIETRSWGTAYRGPLAIHAAKGFPRWARDFSFSPVCYDVAKKLGDGTWFPVYPLGAVIATCTLLDCVRMGEFRFGPEGCHISLGKYTEMLAERPQELDFGDYSIGRFAWILGSVTCFEKPVEAKGALGLWNWSES